MKITPQGTPSPLPSAEAVPAVETKPAASVEKAGAPAEPASDAPTENAGAPQDYRDRVRAEDQAARSEFDQRLADTAPKVEKLEGDIDKMVGRDMLDDPQFESVRIHDMIQTARGMNGQEAFDLSLDLPDVTQKIDGKIGQLRAAAKAHPKQAAAAREKIGELNLLKQELGKAAARGNPAEF